MIDCAHWPEAYRCLALTGRAAVSEFCGTRPWRWVCPLSGTFECGGAVWRVVLFGGWWVVTGRAVVYKTY